MNPWLLAACLAAGFGAGWQVQAWRYTAAQVDQLAEQVQASQQAASQADAAASGHEATKERIRVEFQTVYRDVERVVEKPVYLRECLDADGLSALAHAIAGPRAASEPGAAVPGPDAAR